MYALRSNMAVKNISYSTTSYPPENQVLNAGPTNSWPKIILKSNYNIFIFVIKVNIQVLIFGGFVALILIAGVILYIFDRTMGGSGLVGILLIILSVSVFLFISLLALLYEKMPNLPFA